MLKSRSTFLKHNVRHLAYLDENKNNICTYNEHVPLSVVAYATRRILHPVMLPEKLPWLLDLLWQVDAWHRRIVRNAADILVYQEFYGKDRNQRQYSQLLSASEEAEIREIASDEVTAKLRAAYCECTLLCCQYVGLTS